MCNEFKKLEELEENIKELIKKLNNNQIKGKERKKIFDDLLEKMGEYLSFMFEKFIHGNEKIKAEIISSYMLKITQFLGNKNIKITQSKMRKYYNYLLSISTLSDNEKLIKISLLKPYSYYEENRPSGSTFKPIRILLYKIVDEFLKKNNFDENLFNQTLTFFESLVAYSKTK